MILRIKLAHLNYSLIFSDFDYLVGANCERMHIVQIVTPVGCWRSALKVAKLEPGVIGKQYRTTRTPPSSISLTFLQAGQQAFLGNEASQAPSNAVNDNPFPARSGSRSKRRSTSRKSSGCDPEAGPGSGVGKGAAAVASATSDCGGSAIGGNTSTG